jgi:hypothetical protein
LRLLAVRQSERERELDARERRLRELELALANRERSICFATMESPLTVFILFMCSIVALEAPVVSPTATDKAAKSRHNSSVVGCSKKSFFFSLGILMGYACRAPGVDCLAAGATNP